MLGTSGSLTLYYFWNRIRELSVRGTGLVYVTTPNSMTLPNVISGLKNLVTLRSSGISVDSILSVATYGHHCKEYSRQELIRYFSAVDARILTIRRFNCDLPSGWDDICKESIKRRLWVAAKSAGRSIPVFKEQLECILKYD